MKDVQWFSFTSDMEHRSEQQLSAMLDSNIPYFGCFSHTLQLIVYYCKGNSGGSSSNCGPLQAVTACFISLKATTNESLVPRPFLRAQCCLAIIDLCTP